MNFLIDEYLHTSLIGLAHAAGHTCDHVNFLGLGGKKDWQFMATIRSADYTFVRNSRSDFSTLYGQETPHADWSSLFRTSRLRVSVSSSGRLSHILEHAI
ncbi:MAG TPA: DUF5615 family PIN-like protein [Bryobacteraceae bacterium]|nr:DUF5615 family PIN-like protein [Bryobacteraceae bacterium]